MTINRFPHRAPVTIATRRALLAAGGGLAAVLLLRPTVGGAQTATAEQKPGETMQDAIRAFVGEAKITPGRVKVDIPPLVENGNSAPVSVTVESPMTAQDFVRRIAIFNERNPQPHVLTCTLGARAGRASVSTRMRLANTQNITAVAELSDGTFWSDSANVIVTLAACTEELL